ncbi:MAG TPA: BBE domain-containing protein [Steroidobacteraceae bacterium]|nr:BBE domain-containing protein [Steroidobacteraceae bacterium]
MADERQPHVDENYRGNVARLRQPKRWYDPSNQFRLNANILLAWIRLRDEPAS